MVERRLSAYDKKAALDSIVEEALLFQDGLAARLRTNQEWATEIGTNRSAVKRLLRVGMQDEELAKTLRLRQKQIQTQAGTVTGNNSYDQGLGAFAMTPEQISARSRKAGLLVAREGKGIHAMTREQRQEVGRKSGLKLAKAGMGCHGTDPETGVPYSVIGGNKSVELGVGVHGRSAEQRAIDGVKGSEFIDHRKVQSGENFYDSYYEAATATLLEKYIPGFVVIRGETYQITQGISKKIDFYVAGAFVEFNPIILSKTKGSLGAFETEEEFLAYKQESSGLNPKERKAYKNEITNSLKQRYYQRRRASLDESADFREKELIVVINEGELYDDVMQRFGSELPPREDFIKEFTAVTNSVKSENHKQKASTTIGEN